MFYLTGATSVPHVVTLGVVPGALADHLASSGSGLRTTRQMNALRWLEAEPRQVAARCVEPCSHWQKSPHPAVLIRR